MHVTWFSFMQHKREVERKRKKEKKRKRSKREYVGARDVVWGFGRNAPTPELDFPKLQSVLLRKYNKPKLGIILS